MDLIQRLAFSVLRYPEREFLVDGALRLTYAEWDRAVNRAARGSGGEFLADGAAAGGAFRGAPQRVSGKGTFVPVP